MSGSIKTGMPRELDLAIGFLEAALRTIIRDAVRDELAAQRDEPTPKLLPSGPRAQEVPA